MVATLTLHLLVALQAAVSRLHDDDGQTLAEYGLIITVIAVGTVVLSVIVFRETLVGAYNSASTCLNGSC